MQSLTDCRGEGAALAFQVIREKNRGRLAMQLNTWSRQTIVLGLLPALTVCLAAGSAPLTGRELAPELERGGYVILMRHAESPGTPPDAAQAERENIKHERQLDQTGRASARAMGDAFRQLRIPVGQVLSSPTYRALETARIAQFPAPETFEELSDTGKSMNPDLTGTRAAWLRSRVAR